MNGYTDQIILECSRTSSAEGRTNNNRNPAEYTNDLGDGIVLDIGDQIELHSAYISELGAEAGEIEIKDRVTGAITNVAVTHYEKTAKDATIPTGYQWEFCDNRSEIIRGNDKETYLVISPYKTTNGEFTMALPRRYAIENIATNKNWDYFATTESPWTNNLGNVTNTLKPQKLTSGDPHPSQFCTDDYEIVFRNGYLTNTHKKGQIKNNNQRFTIFRADEMFFNASGAITFGDNGSMSGLTPLSNSADPLTQQVHTAKRDPAVMLIYHQVRDLVKLEAKEGFNSPEDVAFDLTKQLNERTNFKNKKFPLGTSASGTLQEITYTSYTETPCYKTYNCGTPWKMNLTTYGSFRNANSTTVTSEDVDNAYKYLSCYQHIGVKRPDFFIEGRKTVNASHTAGGRPAGNRIPQGYDIALNSQCLPLGIHWTEANVAKYDEFFRIQSTYPEFFDGQVQTGENCSGTTNRFFHFNLLDDQFHRPTDSLGYDLYENGAWAGGLVNASMASFPVFFDYNPAMADVKAADVNWTDNYHFGADYHNLAHGWARKMNIPGIPGQYEIGIQFTTLGNKVPNYLYSVGAGHTHIAAAGRGGRAWGFDWHFSAYGNPCIGLWNGFSNGIGISNGSDSDAIYHHSSVNGASAENLPKWLSEIYLGADQPLISYDEGGNRFSISQLHVSEVEGNTGESGRLAGGSVDEIVNPTSNASCYKINKKLLKQNWSPDVAPYTLTLPAGGTVPAIEALSQNLTPWTPYDMMGGIFIEEFVVPEYEWDTNLMGVMGYRWEQFNHSPYNASNRQTRIIDNQQVSNVQYPTTNAQVNEGDLRSYNMNLWNNPVYNINLPTSHTVYGGYHNIHPAIDIVGISSTKITAQELPTKSIRPYYTIRSDILGKNNYIGEAGGHPAQAQSISSKPIIGLVDKVNGYGDYYTEQTGQLKFTNTDKRVITSIKTSIHDPDGTYANCGLTSSVIYKIEKQRNVDMTPLNTLLESKKKSDQKIAMEAEGYIPPQKYTFK